jgi:putative FmdB family regulatory protein
MPIYEYRCSACGYEMEELQRFNEEPLKDCPKCGKNTLQKQVSAAGFQLKGSGWYLTDYASDSKNKKEETKESTDTSAPNADKKTETTVSETKAEKKPEAKDKPEKKTVETKTG